MSKRTLSTLTLLLLAGTVHAANELVTSDNNVYTKSGSVYQLNINNSQTITGFTPYDAVIKVNTNGVAVAFGDARPVGEVIMWNLTTNAGFDVAYGTNGASTAVLPFVLAPKTFCRIRPADGGTNLFLAAVAAVGVNTNLVRVIGIPK